MNKRQRKKKIKKVIKDSGFTAEHLKLLQSDYTRGYMRGVLDTILGITNLINKKNSSKEEQN
ncbi:hypothetical protein HZY83_07565 [Gemella sp. GH3]|uniref:hypothetical protein n=1 Tax=unclassified Gemella TaxID=2624949 RepID=UPI0015D0243F|nr:MULTISPECIES: hypothetical protein [unclassified Gemella]MBF0714532.1 hypothetical protein [Gemella sp. GH3.1]NYS51484.1 hypothetical protein [Gemella sp. GH3]